MRRITFGYFVLSLMMLVTFSSCCRKDSCKKANNELMKTISAQEKQKVETISLNVYIENSGSIDGYVSQMGEFKTDTYALISNDVVDNAKLNYVNDIVLPQRVDARSFILNLTPAQFKAAGGNRGTTDIAKVIDLASAGSAKTPTLLVSDFILSPNTSDKASVDKYFALQTNDIKNTISKLLKKNKDLAVVMLKGVSQFNGYYWNKTEAVSTVNGPRPYYAMLIGTKQQVALLIKNTEKTTHYTNGYSEFSPSVVDYEILLGSEYKVGNFRPCKNSKIHVKKIQTGRRSSAFEFNVAVDFSTLPLDKKYLLHKDNYQLSEKGYAIKSVKEYNDKSSNYTHVITIESTNSKPKPADLEITLKKIFPEWIAQSHDEDGASAVKNKTFGILPLMEGVHLAYSDKKNSNEYYVKMKVFLEK